MAHNTPLKYHFSDKHLWFDMLLLALLFVVASYYPLLKIVPLVASLELFSFFSFHLLSKRSRFQMQGFLGGFLSSTAVFLQTLNDKKFSSISERSLWLTLLFAVCAMLFECLFIIFYLSEELPFIYYLPFITQLIFFSIVILYVNTSSHSRFLSTHVVESSVDIELLSDHPIIWKNVAKFSIIIFVIISTMHFIGSEFSFSQDISILLVSLFEAHAALASVMTQWSLQSPSFNLMTLLFLIILGNVLSKSYLTFKGENLTQKGLFITVLLCSLVMSIVVTLIWYEINL